MDCIYSIDVFIGLVAIIQFNFILQIAQFLNFELIVFDGCKFLGMAVLMFVGCSLDNFVGLSNKNGEQDISSPIDL